MRRKKSEGHSPDIIVTFNFNTSSSVKSFGRFADYTNREEATGIENQAEQSFEEHFESKDYKQMISYMKRESAILNADQKRTGLFHGHSQNMTVEEMAELKDKLSDAQTKGNNLWNGAVSFDIGYLIQTGILDYNAELEAKISKADKTKKRLEEQDKLRVKNGEAAENAKGIYMAKKELENLAKQRTVDQEKLKGALQENMDSFLKAEGFKSDAFWWGSVHLNTKHVHIHVSISEGQNSRKRILNEKTGELEPRGKLKIRNIERLKSKIFHNLDIAPDKKQKRLREMEVGKQRENVMSFKATSVSHDHVLLDFYLQEAKKHLPEDGKLSFKSNKKAFQSSKAYLTGFVNSYLEGVAREDLTAWREATKAQLSDYAHSYSGKFDLEGAIEKREKTLREAIGNKVLRELKTEELSQNETEDAKSFLSTADYKALIDELKANKLNAKAMGEYKHLLSISQAEDDEVLLKKDLSSLQYFEKRASNKDLLALGQEQLKEKIQLAQMKQLPRSTLSIEERQYFTDLELKYSTAREVLIPKATPQLLAKKNAFLDQEKDVIEKSTDKALLKELYGTDKKKEILEKLQKETAILGLKGRINQNNQSGNKKDNGPLFKELKVLYGEEEKEGQRDQNKRNTQSKTQERPVYTKFMHRFTYKNQRSGRTQSPSKQTKSHKSSFSQVSRILSQLDFKDTTSKKARRAQQDSDEREERER
ncbi:relaxase MobL [Lactococcus garvieae]|uniref:relaxase MobL n=1 Tax=Lactococcus garvieae TaxID=1363 RepID=UPI00324DD678